MYSSRQLAIVSLVFGNWMVHLCPPSCCMYVYVAGRGRARLTEFGNVTGKAVVVWGKRWWNWFDFWLALSGWSSALGILSCFIIALPSRSKIEHRQHLFEHTQHFNHFISRCTCYRSIYISCHISAISILRRKRKKLVIVTSYLLGRSLRWLLERRFYSRYTYLRIERQRALEQLADKRIAGHHLGR